MKMLLFAMGPGEACHAYAMARHLVEEKHRITFALKQECNNPFFHKVPFFASVVTPTIKDLQNLVKTSRPDVILLCNSKAFNDDTTFVETRPWPVPTFSIDSNWLFEPAGALRCLQWLDGYFITFPSDVFELGLQRNGGHFTIPDDKAARIKPIGFLPSYQKPAEPERACIRQQIGVHDHEKLIFCYVSGHGATLREFVLEHIFGAVSRLRASGYMIKVCVIGNIQLIQERFPCSIADWLIFRELTADDFYAHLASADLVFQHQGLATMAQAISAQIPVIAHVRHQRPSGPDWIENAELSPLQRAGLCKLFSAESPIEAITQMVEELLYHPQAIEQIQQIQQAYRSQGEHCISRTIMQYLEIRDEHQLTWATR